MTLADKRNIVRYINGEYVELRDLMVHEMTLHLNILDVAHKALYCSPSELFELVLGHLYTQRYIRRIADIETMDVDEEAGIATVKLNTAEANRIVTEDIPLSDKIVFDPEALLRNQERFYDESTLQKATAGIHRSALCSDWGSHMACIDVSRHNTIDKVTGKALMNGVSLHDKYIITSGRIPKDMIQKAVAIGIPMIVSRSTPTIAAVEVAKKANITLLGFSRENRFNIYTAPYRLKGCPVDSLLE
ncbi:MAG: formate dehydrogenase accessory sulfurtransferase FdhD [Christensenellales bacterium]